MDYLRLRGNCTRGENCAYPHLNFHEMAVSQMQNQSTSVQEMINNSASSADNVELCKSYFMHGNCQYKSKCYKLHTANSWFCMDYLRGKSCSDLSRLVQTHPALFRNKRFVLNEMFQQNASKFAIFYV